jgi:hypothetical protein
MHNLWRRLPAIHASAVCLALLAPYLVRAFPQRPEPEPQPRPSANAPKNENVPMGLEGGMPSDDAKQQRLRLDKENQKQIRLEVQQLYSMVSELKDEVGKTDPNSVFSVTIVKKAQEIEKLAKNIKNRAKR